MKSRPDSHDSAWIAQPDEPLVLFDRSEDIEFCRSVLDSLGIAYASLPVGTRRDGSNGYAMWVASINWSALKAIMEPWFEVEE